MLLNLLLASTFLLVSLAALLSFDRLFSGIARLVKLAIRLVKEAITLTGYLSRAIMRYRKSTYKSYLH